MLCQGFGSLDSIEPSKLVPDKVQDVSNTTIISEIDRTMKKHADTLLHVIQGVSARLTQLETRTHNLENLVDDLKLSVDNTHGSTDGKMRQLINILVEVTLHYTFRKFLSGIVTFRCVFYTHI